MDPRHLLHVCQRSLPCSEPRRLSLRVSPHIAADHLARVGEILEADGMALGRDERIPIGGILPVRGVDLERAESSAPVASSSATVIGEAPRFDFANGAECVIPGVCAGAGVSGQGKAQESEEHGEESHVSKVVRVRESGPRGLLVQPIGWSLFGPESERPQTFRAVFPEKGRPQEPNSRRYVCRGKRPSPSNHHETMTTCTKNSNDATTAALTILDQLGGSRKVSVMVGAKHFLADRSVEGNPVLSFKIGRGAKNKINSIRIELTADDLYTVTFQRIWGAKVTCVETLEGCYADMLVELFEDRTGLYLSI